MEGSAPLTNKAASILTFARGHRNYRTSSDTCSMVDGRGSTNFEA
jgi:hypothetical protein